MKNQGRQRYDILQCKFKFTMQEIASVSSVCQTLLAQLAGNAWSCSLGVAPVSNHIPSLVPMQALGGTLVRGYHIPFPPGHCCAFGSCDLDFCSYTGRKYPFHGHGGQRRLYGGRRSKKRDEGLKHHNYDGSWNMLVATMKKQTQNNYEYWFREHTTFPWHCFWVWAFILMLHGAV